MLVMIDFEWFFEYFGGVLIFEVLGCIYLVEVWYWLVIDFDDLDFDFDCD